MCVSVYDLITNKLYLNLLKRKENLCVPVNHVQDLLEELFLY